MAINFDGDDYLTKDYSGTGPISSYPFTMAAWFKPPEEWKDWQGFVLSDGTETARYGMGPANYGVWAIYAQSIESRSASGFAGGYSKTSPNDWSHAACIFNASNDRKLYVNGSSNLYSNGTNIGVTTLTDADVVGMGYGPTNGNNAFYKGDMAECGLWNAALTTAEIDSLAAGFSPLFIRPNSLIGYWPLGGPYSDYTDVIGQNTLSATGDPAASDHPRIIYPMLPPAVMVAAGGQAARAMHYYRMLRCS